MPPPPDAARSGAGLDEGVWGRLCAIVAAAHRGDPDEFAGLWLKLERELTDEQRGLASVYLLYLLEYRVCDILRRRPQPEDLHALASRAYPEFAKLIRESEASLADTLLTVFKFALPGRTITGGRLLVAGSAAFTVLTEDPVSKLAEVKPFLAQWYAKHEATLKAMGSWAPPRTAR